MGFIINDRNDQFNDGNDQQDPECSPDRLRIKRVLFLLVMPLLLYAIESIC